MLCAFVFCERRASAVLSEAAQVACGRWRAGEVAGTGWVPCSGLDERSSSGDSSLNVWHRWAQWWVVTLESGILAFLLLPVVNERVARSAGTAYFSFLLDLCTSLCQVRQTLPASQSLCHSCPEECHLPWAGDNCVPEQA